MAENFDIEECWPELFEPLDVHTRHAVVQAIAVGWYEGFYPTREEVQNATTYMRGVIDIGG